MLLKLLFFTAFLCNAECLKILGLFPHHGRSHHDVFEPLLIHLAKKGHQITAVSHFTPKEEPQGWKFISMGNYTSRYREFVELAWFTYSWNIAVKFSPIENVFAITRLGIEMCDAITSLDDVKKMVNTKERFDVILVEQFNSDCALGIAHLLDAPVIGLQSHVLMPWTLDKFSQPAFHSYAPNLFLGFKPHMTFWERLENTLYHYALNFVYYHSSINVEQEIIEKNLGLKIPPLDVIGKNLSALLSNTHHMYSGVKPLVPGIIEVGGIHLKRILNSLDKDVEKFMNESSDGVILFSMGSMIKASSMPEEKLKAFVETFASLRQRIIWKWEATPPKGLPDNVMIVKWVQQMEILHHPKTVAFISHGGMLGTTEALHAGVPMMFLPVFGDQFVNSAAGEESGLGIKLPYSEVNKEKLQNGLKKILSIEMRKSAKSLSDAWRDRPDPLNVAAAEIEHVARHGGHRRRSPARDLLPHQVLLLDVIAFLGVVFFIIIFILYSCFKSFINFCSKCFISPTSKNSNKVKSN